MSENATPNMAWRVYNQTHASFVQECDDGRVLESGELHMASGDKKIISAAECSGRAGRYAFGVDEIKTAGMLRRLADDIESGRVMVHSVTTACHAAQEEFTVRELTVEIMEEAPAGRGPQVVPD